MRNDKKRRELREAYALSVTIANNYWRNNYWRNNNGLAKKK